MRFLIFIILLTSCKSIYISQYGHIEIDNKAVRRLNDSVNDYKIKNQKWPTVQYIDSLRLTDMYINRLTRIDLIPENDSTINVDFKLEYIKFENPIQSMEMTESLISKGNHHYRVTIELVSLTLQNGNQLGTRTKLTSREKKLIKKWDRERKKAVQLTLENLKTKKTRSLKIETPIYLFSNKNKYLSVEEYRHRIFWKKDQRKWTLTSINASDSTVDIDVKGEPLLRTRVKISDIDSLRINSKVEKFKIVGVKK